MKKNSKAKVRVGLNHRFCLTAKVFFSETFPTQTRNLQLSDEKKFEENLYKFLGIIKERNNPHSIKNKVSIQQIYFIDLEES